MRHVLSAGTPALARLARSRALLAFDFDGTLAPIVLDRRRAVMRDSTRSLLRELADLYPCAVISGRRRDDLAPRVRGVALRHVVGNHGIDHGAGDGGARFAAQAARMSRALRPALEEIPGVELEDKRYSVAIHYRRAANRRTARRRIAIALASLDQPVRVVGGKLVVDVIPRGAPDKGDALAALQAAEGTERALYVGDDRTDEDVFRTARAGRVVSIRVGRSSRSAARFYLRDQREVDRLLGVMIALRTDDDARSLGR